MSTEQSHYDIFLSYARVDNVALPGSELPWVEAIKQRIEEDHARFSNQPLRIFYDAQEIRSMDDWRHRILGALRHSRLLLVCTSPAYFGSDYCRWEWNEYQRRMKNYKQGEDTIANVRFQVMEAPSDLEARSWYDATRTGNYTDLSTWYSDRTDGLKEEEVGRTLDVLGEQIWERMQRIRQAEAALEVGNVRGVTPYFVGRRRELREIHEQVGLGRVGLVSAVHAQGGIGKTELAVHYARTHAHSYPAGIWMLDAEGRKEMLPLIGTLAKTEEFGLEVPKEVKDDENRLGQVVLRELQKRSREAEEKDPDGGGSTLLILDNVTEPALLSLSELVKLKEPSWLRMLATSRRGDDEIAPIEGVLTHLPIPVMSREEALDLLDAHTGYRFRSDAKEWAAIEEIVRMLGGFTLALDQVGAFLGLHLEEGVLPSNYLERLQAEGLTGLDELTGDQQVSGRILHQEKQYSVILEWTLNDLARTPLAMDALRFASLLPSARIPWKWLELLIRVRHGDAAEAKPGHPAPWATARRRLQGMRLVLPGDQEGLARMHDLTSAHVRKEALRDNKLLEELQELLVWRCTTWSESSSEGDGPGELEVLNDSLIGLLDMQAAHWMYALLGNLVDPVSVFLGTDAALRSSGIVHTHALQRAQADPTNKQWQRNLSLSFNKLGNLSSARGNFDEAARLYGEDLRIAESLAQTDPTNSQWQRDLSVSYTKLGDLSSARGNLDEAARLYGESLKVAERLAQADPNNSQRQRDLSVCYNNLGDLSIAHGNLDEAARLYGEDLKIAESLAQADPTNSQGQRDLSVSYMKLGDLSKARGDLDEAARLYGDSLKVTERLAQDYPTNSQWQRDLSVCYNKLGDLSRARGNLVEAARLYGESLKVRVRLVQADPTNRQWQRDLSMSYDRLGDLNSFHGNLDEAARLYGESLKVAERLAQADPTNIKWQRDLSVCYNNLGDLSFGRDDFDEAARHYGESLKVAERLAQADANNSQWQHDLSVSYDNLGNLNSTRGNLDEAAHLYGESLKVAERLAQADPTNIKWQRALSNCYNKLGDLHARQQQDDDAIEHYLRGLSVLDPLIEKAPHSAPFQHDRAMFNHDLFMAYGRKQEWQSCIAHALAVVQTLATMEERGMELDDYLKRIGEQCVSLLKKVQEQQPGESESN